MNKIHFLFLLSCIIHLAACKYINQFLHPHNVSSPDMSLVEYQSNLYSEIDNEIRILLQQQYLSYDDSTPNNHNHDRMKGVLFQEEDVSSIAQHLWKEVVHHGWYMCQTMSSHYHQKRSLQNIQDEQNESSVVFPFMVCSHSRSQYKSGNQRLEPMLKLTGAHLGDRIVVRNDPYKTCYHISMEYEAAQRVRSESMKMINDDSLNDGSDYFTLVPMTDLMKIQPNTMSIIFEEFWTPMPTNKAVSDDWVWVLSVGISTGHRIDPNEDKVKGIANSIIDDVQILGQNGAQNRQRLLQEGNQQEEYKGDDSWAVSLSDLFSLVAASDKSNRGIRYLRKKNSHGNTTAYNDNSSRWTQSIELGLEADHSCDAMFEMMRLDVHFDNEGFDIILNRDNDGVEEGLNKRERNDMEYEAQYENKVQDSSASNKYCVASLVMALSTHPKVLSVEVEKPITADDYEAQWITQSKVEGERPFRDIGIDGTNQVISIIDSGIDTEHNYFGPSGKMIFNKWDHSQRKVVRYDSRIGDEIELKGGHGTKVAGVAAGSLYTGYDNEANGVAEGAKLHIFDIQKSDGGFMMPPSKIHTIFKSMHKTDKTPARIANGSWSTNYRDYPFSCKIFDQLLHGEFKGDLYVASAGNEGFDQVNMQSKPRTIGNPASCKNTLAVGASLSHGNRLPAGGKGIDYLAAFSSRGPTDDNRMKPDVVAPGAAVLTASAHEIDKVVQVYGTSFAAPVVAGSAALVREYFEGGRLPCKWANCALDPSGTLVKAVLLNSARPIKQVQDVSPWLNEKKVALEEICEYDSNQGMGLIQLNQTLPIPGHNKFNAVIRNNKKIMNGEFQDIFIKATPYKCLNTSYKHDFSATLTWYDPAGAVGCVECLVNDLDIMVHWITTNGKVKPGSKIFPNGAGQKDKINNVERIRFKMQATRRYRVRVKAFNLAMNHTQYSMIATGCVKVTSNPAL